MSHMINFGIDLGTTNSLIAKFVHGAVEIYKNPVGHKQTLPSVVGFRKDRIIIGDQARTYAERDPKNVISRFKRKMGTTESYPVKSLGQTKTPVELSSLVLKELKTFIHTGEIANAAVITVPASFDLLQSNATTQAGSQAGLEHVILLQEPIAASLAYANKSKSTELRNSQWLVYDLGGGTFDVALIRIVDGDLKVVDHEGDNFLGGSDFDERIVEELIVPAIKGDVGDEDLLAEMKSQSGKYNATWYRLLHLAEEAKVQLSSRTAADIEFSMQNSDGEDCDFEITLTRSEFENLIKPDIDRTAEMIRTILTRNCIQPHDVSFVLMVGGSTYIPYVRSRIGELLQIPVNVEIDPVTAVVEGAAMFAGTREEKKSTAETGRSERGLRVRMAYNRTSHDPEELFSAKIEGNCDGLFYRIVREDGGYDSGLKSLAARISEDLPLQEDAYNTFILSVLDGKGHPVDRGEVIQISHGKYSVAGQPVTQDVCLVLDDIVNKSARLFPIFQKNAILPASARHTVTVNRTVARGRGEDVVRIMVVEGPAENPPHANVTIGHLSIAGTEIQRDVFRGTDIDLQFEMSESRELKISAYLTTTNQTFERVFTPEARQVDIDTLRDEVKVLYKKLEQEVEAAEENEEYETAKELTNLGRSIERIDEAAMLLPVDNVTDDHHKLDAEKRAIAATIERLTREKRIDRLRQEYMEVRELCADAVANHGNDRERRRLDEIVAQERVFLASTNPSKIEQQTDCLRSLRFGILRRTPEFLRGWFDHLVSQRERFNNQSQAKSLIEAGRAAIATENWDRVDEINFALYALLPDSDEEEGEWRFTGIS